MKEADYQRHLLLLLKTRFSGCIVMKNDANYKQGFPDLTILFEDRWACLEVKASADASRRPNQAYYVHRLNEMSFAAFIYPENEVEVLDELQRAFGF